VDESGTYHGRIWFLSDDTERRRAEAERSELLQRLQRSQRSQAFLLDASRVLAGAEGYAETLERLAAVAVPTLGDICLIDVVGEDGSPRHMAARHADPRRQPLVDVLRRRFPPDPAGMHPSVDVTLSRRSRWSAEMSDDFLRATCRDAEHFALVKRLGFTSYMTVPLVAGDEVLGTVTLVSAGSGRRFGPEDLALTEDLADRVAQVVAKARRYDEEHRVAHTLQESLLPAGLPDVSGLVLARRYEAGPRLAEVGGDWFDVVTLGNGAVRVAVGDVEGHDVAAAAAMGQLRSACRALTEHAASPAELVAELGRSWDHLGIERIATLVVAQVDVADGVVEVASAGHPPPLVVSGTTSWFLPMEPGPPLGAPSGAARSWRGRLDPDVTLLLYTDGLIEERGEVLDQGLARLAELATGITDPERLCDHVLAHAPQTRDDDIALLALAIRPR
jgi:serine/threonine-protein kinase RsbW